MHQINLSFSLSFAFSPKLYREDFQVILWYPAPQVKWSWEQTLQSWSDTSCLWLLRKCWWRHTNMRVCLYRPGNPFPEGYTSPFCKHVETRMRAMLLNLGYGKLSTMWVSSSNAMKGSTQDRNCDRTALFPGSQRRRSACSLSLMTSSLGKARLYSIRKEGRREGAKEAKFRCMTFQYKY